MRKKIDKWADVRKYVLETRFAIQENAAEERSAEPPPEE